MATVICWTEPIRLAEVLSPGRAIWISWGHWEEFVGAAVTVTPRPSTVSPTGGTASNVMQAGPVFTTAVPGPVGGSAGAYIGANFVNAGATGIVGFSVTVSVIRP